jgi:hypothetical protein
MMLTRKKTTKTPVSNLLAFVAQINITFALLDCQTNFLDRYVEIDSKARNGGAPKVLGQKV